MATVFTQPPPWLSPDFLHAPPTRWPHATAFVSIDSRETHARALLTDALASVSHGRLLVRVRVRIHHVFWESEQTNKHRMGLTAKARICTRCSTRRSTFLVNPLQNPGSPRRRAPGAHQREGLSSRLSSCFYRTHFLLATWGRSRSRREANY